MASDFFNGSSYHERGTVVLQWRCSESSYVDTSYINSIAFIITIYFSSHICSNCTLINRFRNMRGNFFFKCNINCCIKATVPISINQYTQLTSNLWELTNVRSESLAAAAARQNPSSQGSLGNRPGIKESVGHFPRASSRLCERPSWADPSGRLKVKVDGWISLIIQVHSMCISDIIGFAFLDLIKIRLLICLFFYITA